MRWRIISRMPDRCLVVRLKMRRGVAVIAGVDQQLDPQVRILRCASEQGAKFFRVPDQNRGENLMRWKERGMGFLMDQRT